MKRIFTILLSTLLVVAFTNARNLKVVKDAVSSDGSRFVRVDAFNAYCEANVAASAQLCAIVVSSEEKSIVKYFLQMNYNEGPIVVEKGNKLLLKLDNGDVMTIEAASTTIFDAWNYSVSPYGTSYRTRPMYELTMEQITTLIANSIIKIRVETTDGTFDREIKKDKLSKGIADSMPILLGTISVQKNMYSDF